jgi:hypothetical protein
MHSKLKNTKPMILVILSDTKPSKLINNEPDARLKSRDA